ncbi:hypothetical protein [Seinonella peptonophila]|uniref:hypothetical protein n=1 Tax=Seinonella peptonophila TaxID=112248 RepID=UPI0009353DD0|nr:hypothetical protein [Seinonella peptonophila]
MKRKQGKQPSWQQDGHYARLIAMGAAVAVAMTLTASCGTDEENPDYVEICVDQRTGERVEDDQCEDEEHSHGGSHVHFFHYYIATQQGGTIPRVGQKPTGGTTIKPQSGTIQKGAPSSGGKIERGGFGKHGGGSGS